MEKRTLAAIALSVLVLFLFRYVEQRQAGDLAKNRPPVAKRALPNSAPSPSPPRPAPAPSEQEVRPSASSEDTAATTQSVVIEGDLYRAVLDNRGALLTNWQLKHYKSARGEVFEMVAANSDSETRPYPGSLILENSTLSQQANGELYSIETDKPLSATPLVPPVSVVMRLKRGDLSIEKSFHFEKDNYMVGLDASVEQSGKPLPGRMLLAQDIGPEQEHLISRTPLAVISNQAGKVTRDAPPKEEAEVKKEGEIRWVGLDMQYFAVIAIPQHPLLYFDIQKRPVKSVTLDGKEVARDLLRVTVPATGSTDYRVYLGPKQQSFLGAVKGADLSGVIDYGMFSILVTPLLFSLRWIEQFVSNYGVAIIILTLLLSVLLFPIRLKQMISMKKMQVIQPKVKEIQERYKKYKKTDPKRAQMNTEVMALYKEHNVNPLGGCLPLLLQMPLLFAFYSLLSSSIELRQAPFVPYVFFGYPWIRDLSAPDPYYVLPIVMGISMLIQQRMTPMAPGADPTQAKMMLMMPAVFTLMFLNVSSGLNLYFLCSNIFQVAFQKIAERWMGDRQSVRARA